MAGHTIFKNSVQKERNVLCGDCVNMEPASVAKLFVGFA